ncbi:nitrogenase component 1 [Clostridium amazonitimonense]|uniref:nitrogenase component 1 n=1 Tax=Clostridium amazonitimonense TaxID=1499689 RepID=UPI000509D3D4|nr:nitrogenase component 1 [Clostridium amazonitimonense]
MEINSISKENINNLRKLSDIKKDKDIKQGAYAIYPGSRCPLALVNHVFSGINGAAKLIVGTAECTYYNKNISIRSKDEFESNTTWSYSLDPKEVIFGCSDGIISALQEIDKTGAEVIVLVSACVPEMIGEDFQGIARKANSILNAKVIHINAAHFKCYSSIPSKEASLSSLCDIMEKQNVEKDTINLLGEGSNKLLKSEVISLLKEHNIKVNCTIPHNLTVDSLRKAPSAALSIVTDIAALPLAERIHEKFGTPYVLFPHLLDIDEIKTAYKEIASYLDISIEKEIDELYINAKEGIESYKSILKGKTFASGYMLLDPFIHSAFLSSLGMKPVYIEAEYFFDKNKLWSDKILSLDCNPYVGHTFNFSTINNALKAFPVDYFFGYTPIEKSETSAMKCIKYKNYDSELGFEQPLGVLKNICSIDKSCNHEINGEVNE